MATSSARSTEERSSFPVKIISVRPTWTRSPLWQDVLIDPLVVDERAVGAAQVDQFEIVFRADDFGVAPRDLDVVQADGIGRFAADADSGTRAIRSVSLDRDLE